MEWDGAHRRVGRYSLHHPLVFAMASENKGCPVRGFEIPRTHSSSNFSP